MNSDNFGFEELDLWKKANSFKIEVPLIAYSFLTDEKYKLTDQVKRSVRSINVNIAEGHGGLLTLTRYTFAFRQEAPLLKQQTIYQTHLKSIILPKIPYQDLKKRANK